MILLMEQWKDIFQLLLIKIGHHLMNLNLLHGMIILLLSSNQTKKDLKIMLMLNIKSNISIKC